MMKFVIRALSVVLFFASAPGVFSQDKTKLDLGLFSMQIIQDGKAIAPKNGVYVLSNRPFYFQFTLAKDEVVFLNANSDDAFYRAAMEGRDFTKILGFGGTGMAEYRFNGTTDLFLTSSGWHVWYYSDADDHRFIEVTDNKDGTFSCKRYVAVISEDGDDIPDGIDTTDVKRIFIVCVKTENVPGTYETRMVAYDAFILSFY